jgi:hypothetical protein
MCESKESKELIEIMYKYIEFGKQERLIPESINSIEEFMEHENHMKAIMKYIAKYPGKYKHEGPKKSYHVYPGAMND